MKRPLIGLLLSLLALPGLAAAADGVVTANANLRAGPDAGYPRIVGLRAGTPVEILGCINDYSWCDVGVGRERGWVSAGVLAYSDRDQYWSVYDEGPRSRLPVLTFLFASYWDSYYRGRPWYDRRPYWNNYRPVYRPRPPRPVQPPRPIRPPRPIGPPHPGTGGPQIQPPRPGNGGPQVQPPRPGNGGPQIQPPRPGNGPRPPGNGGPQVQPPRPVTSPAPVTRPEPTPMPKPPLKKTKDGK